MEQVERYNQIIDDCYWNHLRHIRKESIQPLLDLGWCVEPNYPAKEDFINKCKTDLDFSQKWGLKIEERELSLEERNDIYKKKWELGSSELSHDRFDALNIPTKLITIKYQNETIITYE